MTSEAMTKSTSLPEPDSGQPQLDLLDGQTTAPSGPPVAHASRSRKRAKAAVLMTQGICGQTWLDSSMAAEPEASDLLSLWESRLRERLATIGSTESALIWRSKPTGHGWSIFRLAPWTPPTSGNGSIGLPWRTPNARDSKGSYESLEAFNRRVAAGRQINLNDEMSLTAHKHQAAPWVTPSTRDWKDSPGMATERPDGRSRIDQLPRQMVATWVTPQARDGSKGKEPPRPHDTGISLPQHMAVTAPTGQTTNGSSAMTEKRGAPNPVFACWLMGWPDELTYGALQAIQSIRSSRRKSSRRS